MSRDGEVSPGRAQRSQSRGAEKSGVEICNTYDEAIFCEGSATSRRSEVANLQAMKESKPLTVVELFGFSEARKGWVLSVEQRAVNAGRRFRIGGIFN